MVMPNASGSFLPETNFYTTSMFGDGLSASNRYLTNEVANSSIDSGGNGTLWPLDVSALNLPQPTPTISKYCKGNRFSSGVNQYMGCQNHHVLHNFSGEGRPSMSQMPSSYKIPNESLNGGLAFTTTSVQENNGTATPDVYMDSHLYRNFPNPPDVNFQQIEQSTPSDMHTMADCQLYASGNFTSPASSFGSSRNFGISESFVQLLLTDTQTPGSTLEHMLQSGQLNKEIQLSMKRPRQTYETFDQHQHWQKEQYQQQQQVSGQTNMSSLPQSESFLNQPIKMNGSIPPMQVSRSSSYGAAVGSELNIQYRLLLDSLWEHVKNCSGQEQGCQFPCCATVKATLNRLSPCNDILCARGCLKTRLFHHYSDCRKSDCCFCDPVRVELKLVVQGSHKRKKMEQSISQNLLSTIETMAANLSSDTVMQVLRASRTVLGATWQPQAPYGAAVGNELNKQYLLLLNTLWEHLKNCTGQEQEYQFPCCATVKETLNHMSRLNDIHGCLKKRLFLHYSNCRKSDCVFCHPVRVELKPVIQGSHMAANLRSDTVERLAKRKRMEHSSISHSCQSGISKASLPLMDHTHLSSRGLFQVSQQASPTCVTTRTEAVAANLSSDTVENLTKRKKMEHSSISHSCQSGISKVSPPLMDHTHLSPRGLFQVSEQGSTCVTTRTKTVEMEMKSESSTPESFAKLYETTSEVPEVATKMDPFVEAVIPDKVVSQCEQENVKVQMEVDNVELEAKCKTTVTSAAQVTGKMLGKPETKSATLIDSFTPEQVKEHIKSLMQCACQSKSNEAEKQRMEHLADMNSCLLCGMAELPFKPLRRYCASCCKRICPKIDYYSMGSVDGDNSQKSFCGKCYNAPGESVNAAGVDILKAKLKRRNTTENELWVQCDKCEFWQHQICALFNGKLNKDEETEYTCPNCFLKEIESGKHELLPRSTNLGAKDLPKTMLSNHIEQWLFRRLKQERQERAKSLKKNFDEVPRAEDLVVRVVSSVDKKLPVKQLLYEIFQGEKYPTEFPYKSKAIMLFQKIEGADVCVFAMYVQEFGSDCAYPNRRHVCISYLDSVQYFQPEIKTVTGEALRTFVYHEILIGYLDYCKKRGFTTCYIWSCPPATQDNYILYCHPEIQKTPNPRKLREWYLAMIRKATKENIAVDCTNLYDLFFIHTGKCKTKVTTACLPYFDGDSWPGEAEKLLQQKDGNMAQKKAAIERTVRAERRDTSEGNSKDILLMHELGGVIRRKKEDFIMVRLQYGCSHCNQLIMSGRQWVCRACRNFQLCEKCHDSKQNLNMKEKHSLCHVGVENMPLDIHDKDEIMQSDYFDTRMAFLNLCQQNYYQFDTLRRAKHSTMMILYHLHNPTAPTFRPPCTICHDEVEMAQGGHCVICPDYYLCGSCYQREGGVHHDHDLISLSTADFDVLQNKLTPQKRPSQEQMMLDLLLHALKCCVRCCTYPSCQKLKTLFLHNAVCTIRSRGGCKLCRNMCSVLTYHGCTCKEVECHVPWCKDLKNHLRKMQLQSDSR